jgi:hypothetical protein
MKMNTIKQSCLRFTKMCVFVFCGYLALVFLNSGVVCAADTSGTSALYAVDAYASNDVWAVGYKYEGDLSFPLVEHWDGTQWAIVPNPPNVIQSQMHGVAVVAPDDVWIVGATWNVSDLAYVLHWDGATLQSVPCQNPGFYGGFWSVAAVAANDVWAVGDTTDSNNNYKTLVEHWDGHRWSVVPSPSGDYDFLQGVTAVSANDVWAVGYGLTSSEILHWDGIHWSFSTSGTVGDYAGYNTVSAIAADDVWALGFGNGGLLEHWDGTRWNRVPAPRAAYGLATFASDDMWAVGGDAVGSSHRTLAVHWDGVAWRKSKTPSPGHGILSNVFYAVAGVTSNDLWAVGIGQQALTAHWDGNAWRLVHNPGERVR